MSREIFTLRRREDETFEFYEDDKLAEEWKPDDYDTAWGFLLVKTLSHLKNIGDKRLRELKMTKRCKHKWEQKPDYPEDIICQKCQTIKKVSDLTRQQFLKLPLEVRRNALSWMVSQLIQPPCGLFGEKE